MLIGLAIVIIVHNGRELVVSQWQHMTVHRLMQSMLVEPLDVRTLQESSVSNNRNHLISESPTIG